MSNLNFDSGKEAIEGYPCVSKLKYREGTAKAYIYDQLRALQIKGDIYLDMNYKKYDDDPEMTTQAARVLVNRFKEDTGREFSTRATPEGLRVVRRK